MYMFIYILGRGGGPVSLPQDYGFHASLWDFVVYSFHALTFNAHSAQVRFGAYPSIRLRYNVSSEIGSVRIT
jgi:hypothetical protein